MLCIGLSKGNFSMAARHFQTTPSGKTTHGKRLGAGEIVDDAFDALFVETYTLQRLFLTSSYLGRPNVEFYPLPPTCGCLWGCL